jgi:twitching motility protein PilT
MLRVNGDMRRINLPEVRDIQSLMEEHLGKDTFDKFESGRQSFFLFEIEGLAEFGTQLARANGNLTATIRVNPSHILTLDDLKAPQFLRNATEFPRGLILINGQAGSGWSTTMAAMRHEILVRENCTVLTLGSGQMSKDVSVNGIHTSMLVGAGMDFDSYAEALKCAENMDPDYIFISNRLDSLSSSEVRNVLDLARCGYCVYANVNAGCTTDALRQIIGLLDYSDREFAQHQLASVLRVSICQRLLKTLDGGRVACHEHLRVYGDIRKAIENFDLNSIKSALENEMENNAISMKRVAKRFLEQRKITKQDFDSV